MFPAINAAGTLGHSDLFRQTGLGLCCLRDRRTQAEGATTAETLADFPTLCEEDSRAAIAFAAASAQEDLPLVGTPIRR